MKSFSKKNTTLQELCSGRGEISIYANFRQAKGLPPEDPHALYVRANILSRDGKYAEARPLYEQLRRVDGRSGAWTGAPQGGHACQW